MKLALFIFALLSGNFCDAQNYQCLQGGCVKHFFINGNGYLRGMRVDSIKTYSDSIVYYPFHTPRGRWGTGLGGYWSMLDSNGGSWLGKKVVQLGDGTTLFDNLWGDTVVIKTQANIGDTWQFYNDTGSLYYEATLTSIDTVSVLGSFDSAKKIQIRARNATGYLSSDPLDNSQIILSKNNGLVQVMDLYTFPYHKPDSVFTPGNDFYLDHSLSTENFFGLSTPDASNIHFKIVPFINPTANQLSESNVGDVYIKRHTYGLGTAIPSVSFRLDSITGKTVSSGTITYTYASSSGGGGSHTTTDTYLFDTTKMPEEVFSNHPNYYFPNDTTYCTVSPRYVTGWIYWNDGTVFIEKIGFGQTLYLLKTGDPLIWEDLLIYAKKNGVSCGDHLNLGIPDSQASDNATCKIFPNPCFDELTVSSPTNIREVAVINLCGQTAKTQQCNAKSLRIDVSGLPQGVYLIRINGVTVQKFVKQ